MNIEESIVRLETLVLAINDEITQLGETIPEAKLEIHGKLAARVAELTADVRLADREDILKQAAAIRVELSKIADEHYSRIKAERLKVVGLDEIKHTLTAFASIAAQKAIKEFAGRDDSTLPEIVRRELAALPQPAPLNSDPVGFNWADSFKGEFNPEETYQRGNVFAFRGGCYLVLKTSRGVLPTRQEQTGPNARYGLLSAPGSPGRNGNDVLLPVLTALTDGATINWDLTAPVAKVTIAGDRTLAVTNLQAGATYILHVIQGAGGSHLMTWPSSVKWPNAATPVLTTTAAYRDILSFTTDGTYLFGNYSQGYTV